MKLKMIIMTLLIPIVLGACSTASTSEEEHGTVDIKQLVQDYSEGTINDQSASITGTELIITENDDQELVYDLPEDDFFDSIAPFIKETQPCSIHSLTDCKGELDENELDVYIENIECSVIVHQTMNRKANVFIDLWLPREKNYQVNISYDGKVTESEISTFENDDTCITTMQLT